MQCDSETVSVYDNILEHLGSLKIVGSLNELVGDTARESVIKV